MTFFSPRASWVPGPRLKGALRIGVVSSLVFLSGTAQSENSSQSTPLTSHPRLWIRQSDLPALRKWAGPQNRIYQEALLPLAAAFKKRMDSGALLAQDKGSNYGYTQYPVEWHMELFAFMSLVERDAAVRSDYAQRARKLLMYIIQRAATGPIDADRDWAWKGFSKDMRSLFYGEAFALTVDWIYPVLTPADKTAIRGVFKRWLRENLTATTSGQDHPEPVWLLNDPKLLSDEQRRRVAVNNFYNAHLNQIGLLSLALDPADDPGDANDPHDQVRDFLKNAIGAWLFVRASTMKDVEAGGIPPEGMAYGPTGAGRTSEFLLALFTSGNMNTNAWGGQVSYNTPYWNDIIPGLLHASSPAPSVLESWKGPAYTVSDHGDTYDIYLHGYATLLATMGIHARLSGDLRKYNDVRWVLTHMEPGGESKLISRAGDWNYVRDCILHFLLFDPEAPAPVDPRTSQSLDYFAPGINFVSSRTGWDANARWFTFKLPWAWIDHQMAVGNGFEFFRKGEWLTKMWSGYGEYSAGSDYKNTLSLQNVNPATNLSFWKANYSAGSQWVYNSPVDPRLMASSFAADYTYALGDATDLYNNPDTRANDIVEATRSILWLKPDTIVVYDRAASRSNNLFKRFMLNLPDSSPRLQGLRTTAKTAAGQRLYVDTLLPAGAQLSINAKLPDGNGHNETANYEPMKTRLQVSAPGNPVRTHFLHVLRGADANAAAAVPELVSASKEFGFVGAYVDNTVVMFPENTARSGKATSQDFALVYRAPSGARLHLITGLVPNASYRVTAMANGGMEIRHSSSGTQRADGGGVLVLRRQ